jgi:hypothetical protein
VIDLVVDDDPGRLAWFRERLPKAHMVSTYEEAVVILQGWRVGRLFLDFDFQPDRNGSDLAHFIRFSTPKEFRPGEVIIHSTSVKGRLAIAQTLGSEVQYRIDPFPCRSL